MRARFTTFAAAFVAGVAVWALLIWGVVQLVGGL